MKRTTKRKLRTQKKRQPNTALALARALHRYAMIEEPADLFDAVCADWPHHIAVLVNQFLFYEVDECDPEKMIAILQHNINKWRAYPPAWAHLKDATRPPSVAREPQTVT